MTVWCHLPTIFKQGRTLRIVGLISITAVIITTLLFSVPTFASKGINQTLNFQGQLKNSNGSVVDDGFYNIQFKIYQDGTGDANNNPAGALKWTETYLNAGVSAGVKVTNGRFNVNLGSLNPFSNQVDWNQDTLWLSMNVAGTAPSCTSFNNSTCKADGEMLPMKRITSVPLALNSARLGGIEASGFIQNTQVQQTGDFNISGTGIANILKANTGVFSNTLDRETTGILSIGSLNASSIEIGSSSGGQSIEIGASPNNNVTLGSTDGNGRSSLLAGTGGLTIASGGNISIKAGLTDALTIDGNTGNITTGDNSALIVNGQTNLNNGLTVKSNNLGLLTAINNSGVANVGIGNNGLAGYALDVTGQINTSDKYSINGVNTLSNSSLSFSGGSNASISSAAGQSLSLNAKDLTISTNGKNSATFSDTNLQIGTGIDSDALTLLTLDKSASAPQDAPLGSLYYDTTLNKVQCYQDNKWGACGDSPDSFINISPEYTNAVMNGAGLGTITSDFCSDSLNINDGSSGQPAVCNNNETYNFYQWQSSESTNQIRSIYVTYQLPSTFKNFVAGSTYLMANSNSGDSTVSYQIYKDHGGLSTCGSEVIASRGAKSTWQKSLSNNNNDPYNCGFVAGDSMLIRINLISKSNAKAFVSNISFAYSNK